MIRKVLHSFVALMILASTTGFTINLHYCHNHIYDLALFSPAHSCCEMGSKGHCHETGDLDKMNHCKDESIVVESTDDYMGSSYTVSLENKHIIDLFLAASLICNEQGSADYAVFKAPWYKEPPPFREVILSQIQSYLI